VGKVPHVDRAAVQRCWVHWPFLLRRSYVRQNDAVSDERCDLLCLDLEKAEVLRRRRLSESRAADLASSGRALAEPTRLMLAAALVQTDELCVCDLAWVAERPIQAVSYHLGVLRAAGLAVSRREGKIVFYTLTERGRQLIHAHLESAEVRA
jgi:ArsR family transcriptional regulator, lead/cadmium/zinc/bismuth-responsive transcriptional repressor